MKKFTTAILLLILTPVLVDAQDDTTIKKVFVEKADTSVLETVRLDFAVPDIPAFKALGNDPSNMLRPSSPKDIALMLGNFRNESNFIIPQNFAVEITPGLLINPWYTLEAYQKSGFTRFLSKLRFSAGSDKDVNTNVNSLSLGVRSTLLDKGDFRLSNEFLSEHIYKHQNEYTNAWSAHLDEYIINHYRNIEDYARLPKTTRDSIIEIARLKAIQQVGFDLDVIVAEAINKFKTQQWNAPRIDFAYSLLLQSPDSLLSNVKLNKHLFWLVWAFRPSSRNNWSQCIVGINNASYQTSSKFYNEFTGNFRFYAGKNRIKGFIEAQYKNVEHPTIARNETLYAQLGLEVAVYKSIWLHFGAGVLNTLNGLAKTQLQSNLNLYFSFPEQLKLF